MVTYTMMIGNETEDVIGLDHSSSLKKLCCIAMRQ